MNDAPEAIEEPAVGVELEEPPDIDPEFCLTASEAFPILERWFLEARREVIASYRIFDPRTLLRSDAGRAIGRDWFDLIVHVLRKGVTVTLYVSDFDPIAASELHRTTWRSVRLLIAAAEVAGPEAAPLHVVAAQHPSRVGLLPRIMFSPKVYFELYKRARKLNGMSPPLRQRALREMPGLAACLHETRDGVRPRLTLPELIPATHHQKVAVFDEERLTLGGLDLNERRWDTKEHAQAADGTWHDVQAFLHDTGRARAAARHVQTLQRVTGGLIPQPPAPPRLWRTLSRRRKFDLFRLSPRTIANEIARAHRYRIAAAKKLIYLETQFFRDLQTANRLARAGRNNPDLRLLLVLPAAPEDVAFDGKRSADARLGEFLQARCIQLVRRAYGDRLFLMAPVQPRRYDSGGRDSLWGGPIVYVHAKVSIFDDEAGIVSSANLNGRSLYWDTELGVEFTDPRHVERLRRRCFEHWLPKDAGLNFYQLETACEEWRRLALENVRASPEDRRGFVLPYDPKPGERLGQDAPVPNEMV